MRITMTGANGHDVAEDTGRFQDLRDLISTHAAEGVFQAVSPLTGEEIASLPSCSVADVEQAVEDARLAQFSWSTVPIYERARMVGKFADLVSHYRELIMDVVQLETGKTRMDAFEEIMDVILTAAYYAPRTEDMVREHGRLGAIPLVTKARTRHAPRGVVAVITPWNYPFTLFPSDSIPALLAGNTVIAKPAEETSLTALVTLMLFRAAGFPSGAVQVLTGSGPTLGPALIEAADFVQFTGGTETGRKVAEIAGAHLTPVSLELGGKNPMIVFEDSPIELAVSGAIKGSFANAGQLCLSFERIYVDEKIYDRFRERLVQRVERLRLGTGSSLDVEVGSLISKEHLEKVQSHVQDALDHGATLLVGGRTRPDLGPFFFEPTVLEDVSIHAQLFREETFGPVVALYRFSGEEEVIASANDSEYGLHAAVWSADVERAQRVAHRLQFGTVAINDTYLAMWGSSGMPMGGAKASGLGRRHGPEGLLKYTDPRSIVQQRIRPLVPPLGMRGSAIAPVVDRLISLRRLLSI
jgi:succinate-semialdehyde dehydrogenase / glutarate-semialdehyde dehydrogenase